MTLTLSRLARRVGHSGTIAVDERMRQLTAQGRDIVSLGAGQLDFDTPSPIAAAGTRAIEEGDTRYTAVSGTPALRRAARLKFERENGLLYGDDQIIAGAGAKSVIFHALMALVDPEDVVLVPTPAWPSYAAMIGLVGGRAVPVPLVAAEGYTLTADAIVRAIASARGRARGIVINSPHNPTGAVWSRETLGHVAEVLRGEGLWAISDEIYEHLTYDGAFTSFATLPGMQGCTLTVNGVSKAFAMTGWRIGYAGGPLELVRAMDALQSHTSGNPSSIAQAAAESALRLSVEGDAALAAEREAIHAAMLERRELACRELAAMPSVSCVRPAGAFYVFADVSRHFGRTIGEREIRGSSDLAEILLDRAGVAVVPGAVFGDDRCIRLSFATSPEELRVALKRIQQALA